jgi:hypothetical protein
MISSEAEGFPGETVVLLCPKEAELAGGLAKKEFNLICD